MKINTGIHSTNSLFKSKQNYSDNKNKPINTTMSESQYNKIAAFSGLSVLACLGIALTYKIKPHNNTGRKKYVKPCIKKLYDSTQTPIYSGPSISNATSISKAWNNYISTIEKRIESYHCNNYEKVFTKIKKN